MMRLPFIAWLALVAACGEQAPNAEFGPKSAYDPTGAGLVEHMEGATLLYPDNAPLNWLTTDQARVDWENECVALVNAHRASLGIGMLDIDPAMTRCARGHCRNMFIQSFTGHTNPEGDTGPERMAKNGILHYQWGENVCVGFETPQDAMAAWLNSPGHRAAIENPAFVRIGVGNYQWRWTQLFAR